METGEDSVCRGGVVLFDEPARRFWEEMDADAEEEGGEGLQGEGEAPGERGVGVGATEADPLLLPIRIANINKVTKNIQQPSPPSPSSIAAWRPQSRGCEGGPPHSGGQGSTGILDEVQWHSHNTPGQ